MSAASFAKVAWVTSIFASIALVSLAGRGSAPITGRANVSSAIASTRNPLVDLGDGRQGLADSDGHVTPLRDYRRIAAGSHVADQILLELAEPQRIVVLSHYGHLHGRKKYLYGNRGEISGAKDLEALRDQRVDLLLLNHFGAQAELARVRDAGIEVFNLGEMRGLATLPSDIDAIAILLGEKARGVRLAHDVQQRMRAVAADIPNAQRKRALYVSAYGGQFFGGAKHTSYHDVLAAAGLIDVAAERYSDWPHYDPEQLLVLDPEIIITAEESVSQICQTPGLDHLRACTHADGVLGFDSADLGDASLGMLDTAEDIRTRVYGPMP